MWRKISGLTLTLLLLLLLNAGRTTAQQNAPSPFGMNAHLSLRYGDGDARQQAVALMTQANISWIREEFNWEEIQPFPDRGQDLTLAQRLEVSIENGGYRWQWRDDLATFDYDTSIQLAEENGLDILGVLTYGPRTNVTNGVLYDKTDCMAFQSEPVASIETWLPVWRQFVRAVVEMYGDQINYWEIGNEPNTECFWRKVDVAAAAPDAAAYVTILQATAEEIRTADPNAQIVLGGIVPPPGNDRSIDYFLYLKQIHDAGGWPHFDILAIHPYWSTFSPETIRPRSTFNTATFSTQATPIEYKFDEEILAFQYMLERLGEKPIWLTEYGWSEVEVSTRATERGTYPALVQSDYLIRSTIMALSAGVDNIMWYDFRNDDTPDENQATFGLVQRDFTRKDAYYAYKNMATLLAGSTFVEQVRGQDDRGGEQDDDVYEYHFRNGSQTIVALWKARGGGAPRAVTVNNIAAQTVAVYGPIFGGAIEPANEITVTDNSVTLSLTERPLFLVFNGDILGEDDNDDDSDGSWWDDLPSIGDWWENIGDNWQDWWQEQQDNIEQRWQEQQEAIARWLEEQLEQVLQDVVDAINQALSEMCAAAFIPLGGALAVMWNGRRAKKDRQD